MDRTAAEQLLWDAYPTGTPVDLAGHDDPVVSAATVAQLLLGGCEGRAGFVPAVRLRNARLTGRLDVTGGQIDCELRLEHCVLDEAPRFANAHTRQLRLSDCAMPGFDGGGLRADGYFSLSGSVIDGQVKLVRAQLLGGFRMNGTKITAQDHNFAFFSGGMVVEAGMFGRNCVVTGGMRITGSRLNGGLFLEGARLVNPGRIALDAQNVVALDAVECSRGFSALGRVKFRNAQIDGTLSFDLAGPLSNPGGLALHLSHMQVAELNLGTAEPVDGELSLVHSRIGVLMDRGPASWPRHVSLNGTVYESLRGGGVSRRIDWVGRDPDGFRPQPYEQLSAWYLKDGNEHLARRAQLMKMRRRRKLLPWPSRTWSALLDYTVGYGYRPWQSAAWLAALIVLGTVVFSVEHPRPIKDPGERPDFHAFAYVIDLLIPIGALGQREAWDAVGWTQWLAYGLIAAGWILATVLIAGATRVLRPN